jgi:hypothetical protein
MSFEPTTRRLLPVYSVDRDRSVYKESSAFTVDTSTPLSNVTRVELAVTNVPKQSLNVDQDNFSMVILTGIAITAIDAELGTVTVANEPAVTQADVAILDVRLPHGRYSMADFVAALQTTIHFLAGKHALRPPTFTVTYAAATDKVSLTCDDGGVDWTLLPRLTTAETDTLVNFLDTSPKYTDYGDLKTTYVYGISPTATDSFSTLLSYSMHDVLGIDSSTFHSNQSPATIGRSELFDHTHLWVYILELKRGYVTSDLSTLTTAAAQQAHLSGHSPIAKIALDSAALGEYAFDKSHKTYVQFVEVDPPVDLPSTISVVFADSANRFARFKGVEHVSIFRCDLVAIPTDSSERDTCETPVDRNACLCDSRCSARYVPYTSYEPTRLQTLTVDASERDVGVYPYSSYFRMDVASVSNVWQVDLVSSQITQVLPNVRAGKNDAWIVLHNFSWTPHDPAHPSFDPLSASFTLWVTVPQARYTEAQLAAEIESQINGCADMVGAGVTYALDLSGDHVVVSNSANARFTILPVLSSADAALLEANLRVHGGTGTDMTVDSIASMAVTANALEAATPLHALLGFADTLYHRNEENDATTPVDATTPPDAFIPSALERTAAMLWKTRGTIPKRLMPDTYVLLFVMELYDDFTYTDMTSLTPAQQQAYLAGYQPLAQIFLEPSETVTCQELAYDNRLSFPTARTIPQTWTFIYAYPDRTFCQFAETHATVFRVTYDVEPVDSTEL